ncbi:hypothetical protein C8J56DRAFT_890376 [Mycena floridula]|nr:hypothetical protein C8J56DRAFT_890376 [Mycena floridula]
MPLMEFFVDVRVIAVSESLYYLEHYCDKEEYPAESLSHVRPLASRELCAFISNPFNLESTKKDSFTAEIVAIRVLHDKNEDSVGTLSSEDGTVLFIISNGFINAKQDVVLDAKEDNVPEDEEHAEEPAAGNQGGEKCQRGGGVSSSNKRPKNAYNLRCWAVLLNLDVIIEAEILRQTVFQPEKISGRKLGADICPTYVGKNRNTGFNSSGTRKHKEAPCADSSDNRVPMSNRRTVDGQLVFAPASTCLPDIPDGYGPSLRCQPGRMSSLNKSHRPALSPAPVIPENVTQGSVTTTWYSKLRSDWEIQMDQKAICELVERLSSVECGTKMAITEMDSCSDHFHYTFGVSDFDADIYEIGKEGWICKICDVLKAFGKKGCGDIKTGYLGGM